MSEKIPKNPLSFGFYTMRPHKKWVTLAVSCVLIATALDRFTVVILGRLTDALATQPIVMDNIWIWAIAYPLVALGSSLLWRGSGFSGMQLFMNLRTTVYETLYAYLTLHSKDYFNSRFAGALANKIGNAVDGTEDLFAQFLWRFIPLLIGLFWYILFAWLGNPILGIIIAVWATIFLAVNAYFAKRLQPHSTRFAKSLSTLKGKIVDSLTNISLVHEYAYIAGERSYINKYIKKQHDVGLARWQLSEWFLLANGLMIFIFTVAMLTTSIMLFQNGTITVGVVVMVVAIVAELSSQLFFIGTEIRDAARYYGEAQEGLEEILREHTIVDAENASKLITTKGAISINNVSFEYDNKKVFSDFTLSIPAGQKVGIVGRSGAGKTTFVSLLLRHFDVQGGKIEIDNQDIANVTRESLRRAIAFVPQDTSLFHRSIRENIQYSNPEATIGDVTKAAKQAEADTFITDLPDGYDTMVGERGVKLSGGQRQRIAIARAFLKDAPILILDEATSSLDSESEHAIQESLTKLMKRRTVIAIAHRLSTLKKMDRIIIIDNGKIVEDGTPNELLKQQSGVFKNMWDHQVKGFILDEQEKN